MITPSFSLTATERVLPKLALDFTTASLDSRVTFTRTTGASNPATYVNNSGYVTAATDNQPRFDYNPVTLNCKGLLIEESRQNLLSYSEQFENSYWFKNRATISNVDVVVSPSGVQNADRLQEDTTATLTHYVRTSISVTSGVSYTWSVFLKNDTRRYAQIRLGDETVAFGAAFANVDLQLGTITSTGAAVTASSITQYSNSWYRVSITSAAIATTGTAYAYVYLSDGTSIIYTGDGSKGIYVWGAQLEAGTFPTSYIPTTTTALTRNADVATMTGTNFSSWFNASEGTFEIETTASANSDTVYLISSDGTQTANSFYFDNSGGSVRNVTFSNSSAVSVLGLGSIGTVGTINKLCGGYKLNSFAASRNAANPSTDTSGAVPVSPNQLRIGSSPFNLPQTYVSGYVRKIMYWPQRLTNNEIQAFSK